MADHDDGELRDEEDGKQAEEEEARSMDLSFIHRSKVLQVRVPVQATLMEVGQQLVSASGVAPHTLRLLLPRAPALLPFSPLHSSLPISQSGISEGRLVRMMGVLPGEIKEVSEDAGNANDRSIIGFSEEEKRAKRWRSARSGVFRSLPQGKYIFCDFRTLHLPGVELNPPAVKALEIMHKLASDPGIVAIMNKHQWRVGVMTEMAPVGYVGISPECILGYNKNQGEEISLRLRTDDLKGFRKYESIKLTLLHELAHMVHSNHDANFHALNKQLNEEAMSLDWTKSGGHSLGGFKFSSEEEDEEPTDAGGVFTGGGQKLGGSKEYNELGARSAAALAASLRLSRNSDTVQDDSFNAREPDIIAEGNEGGSQTEFDVALNQKSDSDNHNTEADAEPEPNGASCKVADEILTEPHSRSAERVQDLMPGPELDMQKEEGAPVNDSSGLECRSLYPKPINSVTGISAEINSNEKELGVMTSSLPVEQQLDSSLKISRESFEKDIADSAGEYSSLKSMQEYTEKVCQRLKVAIDKLKEEASPSEAAGTIQSLFKIVRNIKEHPQEDKFKRLRKANVVFQNHIARFKGAMELLHVVGFSDGPGDGPEASECLILKRHDPVLLWLAEASLEACIIA